MRPGNLPLALLLLLGSYASGAAAETDAMRVVRYTAALEARPLDADAAGMRDWLLQWLTETPDFEVVVCDILGPIPEDPALPHGRDLLLQQMFGNVAYQIAHPGVKDASPSQMAGMESVLKAYAAILVEEPDARIAYFDDLLARRAQDSLSDHLAALIAERCTRRAP